MYIVSVSINRPHILMQAYAHIGNKLIKYFHTGHSTADEIYKNENCLSNCKRILEKNRKNDLGVF